MKDYYSCRNNYMWIKVDDGYHCLQDWGPATWGTTKVTSDPGRWTKKMNWDAILSRYDYTEAKNKILAIKMELDKKEFYTEVLSEV